MNFKKLLRAAGWTGLVVFALICAVMVTLRARQTAKSAEMAELERQSVSISEASPREADGSSEDSQTEKREKCPIKVDFSELKEINSDIVAWLYCPDTVIDYALLQGSDNNYYLNHNSDGNYNSYGSLFLDYRCAADFSDSNTVIYGHNMQNGTMFGSLKLYRDSEYYEDHSVMYLVTPEHSWRLDVMCGFLHTVDMSLYDLPAEGDTVEGIVWTGLARSTFETSLRPREGDSYVTLSTCAYDYDGARYAIVCRMTEIDP